MKFRKRIFLILVILFFLLATASQFSTFAQSPVKLESLDFSLLVEDYLREPVHNTDFNSDGRVDSEDFAILQENYLK
ncbi:hypothetical protein FJZ40_04130 [Candidatus Shapirobacteria bacterium]|nr:hypothetical protein [Candidatus Shapirobacteria bacterium]MBM3283026.1 hypothetical protein [Candidatus Gottesmanbacteria bacterium]